MRLLLARVRRMSGIWRRISAGLVLILYGCILPRSIATEIKPVRRVLILYELGLSSPSVSVLDQQIRSALEKSPFQIELYREYLETTLFPSPSDQGKIREGYIRKYRDRRPDVVITLGPSPLRFLADSHETVFKDVPVVFGGLSGDPVKGVNLDSRFTGVWDRVEPDKTLEVALRLQPGTKHVVVVGGMDMFDLELEDWFRERLHSYESKLDFIYLTNLPMAELLERLRHLPTHTIVLLAHIGLDAAGTHYVGASQADPMVVKASNAPVYGPSDVDVGHGEIGGYLDSFALQGKMLGEMAVNVLSGQRPQDIPIVKGANGYIFDSEAIRHWGLDERKLPTGSIVLNRQPTIWEAYKKYVITAVLLILGQTLAILTLFWERGQRRRTQKQLRKSEEKFSKAFQRSPLAFTLVNLTNFRFIEVNDTFERYTGWVRNEVIGRTPLEIRFWVDTSQRSKFIKQLRAEGAAQNMEILFRRKDGQLRTGRVSSELIDLNGEPCVLSLIADITEAKQAEKARNDSEERLRLAQQAARIGTFEWNIRTGVNTWTHELERMYGLPRGSFGGTQTAFENLVHNRDRQKVIELVEKSLKSRQPTKGEWRVVWPDGSIHWIAGRWQVFTDESGQPSRMVGVNIDITERKLAEEALASLGGRLIHAQEQERTRIARELHDDINQRLAMLQIDLDRIREHAPSDAELQLRMKELRDSLSEVSLEVQGISHRLHSSKLEYLGLVAACRAFCAELGERQGLEVDFAAEGVRRALPHEVSLALFRVLQESLQNAVKYSGSQHFEVQLRGNDTEIQLTVRDHGKGFDVDAALGGKGLGLISMRERVSLVKGTIAICSKQNGGTEIDLHVPIVATDSEISEVRSGAA